MSEQGDGFKVTNNTTKAIGFTLVLFAALGSLLGVAIGGVTKMERHDVRIGSVEATVAELKGDIYQRLDRMENKIDRLVERR